MFACQVLLKFNAQFLRNLAERDFCHLFQRRVTMNFNPLTHKVDSFMLLPCKPIFAKFGLKPVHLLSKYCAYKFGHRRTDARTIREHNAFAGHNSSPAEE